MPKMSGSEWVATYGVEFDWNSTGSQRDADGWDHNVHAITLTHHGKTLSFTFRTGLMWDDDMTPDTVLPAFASEARDIDYTMSFEEWAEDLGYDTDSRRAEATFNACQRFRRDLYAWTPNQAMFDDFLSIVEAGDVSADDD